MGLEALNFAMAGAREGFGPFLGVYLQGEGFDPAATGVAMSLAGIAGVVATAPLSALVDRTTSKRGAVAAAVVAIAVMAAATSAVVARIPPGAIDDEAARGGDPGSTSALRALFGSRPLLALGFAAFCFMAASGAMLPFLAQSLVKAGQNANLLTGAMTVTVQVVMIAGAAVVPRLADRVGRVPVLAAALGLVAVRAALFLDPVPAGDRRRRGPGGDLDGLRRRRDPRARHRRHVARWPGQRGPRRGDDGLHAYWAMAALCLLALPLAPGLRGRTAAV